MTGIDHEGSAAVEQAAIWLAEQKESPRPAVPVLRRMFGICAVEACEAIALAGRYRTNRSAFA